MHCNHIKGNGKQCRAFAMLNNDFCYSHNPEIPSKIKRNGNSRGGQANTHKNINPLPEFNIKNTKDIPQILIKTINEVRSGQIEIRIANCIGYLTGHLIKAFEISELEKRIEIIERAINK